MRIINIIGIVLTITVCVLTLLSGISLAMEVTHSDNPHNLSFFSTAYAYTTEQVCVFCHTPHGANTYVNQSTYWNATGYQNTGGNGAFLLWNRDITNSSSKSFYTYKSSTFQGDSGQIRVYSLMCMSCHDGVSAINVMTNLPNEESWWWGTDPYAGAGGAGLTTAGAGIPETIGGGGGQRINIGEMTTGSTVADLANDHPVSFDYDSTLVTNDKGLQTPSPQGYVVDQRVRLFPNPDGNLVSMECSTCHDPHTYYDDYRKPFLVISNQNSALCINCHIK